MVCHDRKTAIRVRHMFLSPNTEQVTASSQQCIYCSVWQDITTSVWVETTPNHHYYFPLSTATVNIKNRKSKTFTETKWFPWRQGLLSGKYNSSRYISLNRSPIPTLFQRITLHGAVKSMPNKCIIIIHWQRSQSCQVVMSKKGQINP